MHYALLDYSSGLAYAVPRSRDPAPSSRWERVSPEAWAELTAGGFRVCRSWMGPACGVDPKT